MRLHGDQHARGGPSGAIVGGPVVTDNGLKVAYLTAGAAGMYCGSCLRDNALVTALHRIGVDATLLPTYTPIRTDEPDRSVDQVFMGGVNVYLQQKLPLFRWLPDSWDQWLNRPGLIRLVTRKGATPDERLVGELTLSMLRGAQGRQRKEVRRLIRWLADDLQPDLVNFSNILIAGCAAEVKRQLQVPVVVTLQGDDLFLDSLPERQRNQAISLIADIAQHVDRFVVFTEFYRDYIADYLHLEPTRIDIVPLGISLDDFQQLPARERNAGPPAIGYLARLAPEKGLHRLIDGFLHLARRPGMEQTRLEIAGWLGPPHEQFARDQLIRLDDAGLGDRYRYWGSVDRDDKIKFLRTIDVLSVPTEFQDPKGIYVLEAMAAGVPVVLPAHGAFPELIASTQGGQLVPPGDALALADGIANCLASDDRGATTGATARAAVAQRHSADVMAAATLEIYRRVTSEPPWQ